MIRPGVIQARLSLLLVPLQQPFSPVALPLIFWFRNLPFMLPPIFLNLRTLSIASKKFESE